MCLDTVDKEVKKTKGYGWKVFRRNEDGGLTPCYYDRNKTGFTLNEWIKDKARGRIIAEGGGKYEKGFHIYDTRREARLSRHRGASIKKVLYDNVVATGVQCDDRVIVARKMKILEV